MLRRAVIGVVLASVGFAAQRVEGRVVNAVTGVEIPGAAVNLIRDGRVAYSATTDWEGRFRIESVEAGSYTAIYTARGYWPIPNFLVDEDFERVCGRCFLKERGGQPVPVGSGADTVRLDVKMPPLGRLSGRVLDSAGEPVPGASIQLRWGENWLCKMPSCSGVSRQTKTNERGEYGVTNLDMPGAWLVSAIAPAWWKTPESRDGRKVEWAQTFYPGTTDPELAAKVMVVFGGEISNVDIKLAAVPVHRVRGAVLDESGNRVAAAAVTLGGSPSLTRTTEGDGTFEFEAVAEGEWRISAKVDHRGSALWAGQLVRVGTRDLENVELRPAPPFGMQGKVVMEVAEGEPVPKPPGVTLAFRANPAGFFLTGTPDANGDFQIRNVYPDAYQIIPETAPAHYYLDSIRLGGHDALGSDVEIAPGAQALTITYKAGGGKVRGTVEGCAAGTVRLLPREKAKWRPGFVLFAPCDAKDRYEISAVRPGEYYAIAIAGDSSSPWYATGFDDEGLVRTGSTVTVREGENTLADLRANRQ